MKSRQINSLLGTRGTLFFQNNTPIATGSLLGAGDSYAFRSNDWWNLNDLWSFPYYTFNVMPENAQGNYRNENGYECELSYGNFFFTFPGIKQCYGPSDQQSWNELYVSFAGSVFDLYAQEGMLPCHSPVWQIENPKPWLEKLEAFVKEPRPSCNAEVGSEVSRFLTIIFDMMAEGSPQDGDAMVDDWFLRATVMLTADMHHKVNMQEIADELGMSYATFRVNFTKRCGMPPYKYRDVARLKQAKNLLAKNPHKLCKGIAFTLGFCSGDHFSSYFKRQTGMTPNEYRHQHQKSG